MPATDRQQTSTEEASERQAELFVCWDAVRSQVARVRDLLTAHHKLISDVRLLLKAIAKVRLDIDILYTIYFNTIYITFCI